MSHTHKKDVGALVRKSGVSFRVWAPNASSVGVTGTFNNWSDIVMTSEDDGYWHVFVHGARAGQEYKFRITNGDRTFLKNDPRALHFTTSAGNSVITEFNTDMVAEPFTPPPLEKQVIYELHVGTFNRDDPAICGNFDTLIAKLDYLQALGINMIELMPISSMMMDRGWGYAIDYIYSVESLYGGRYKFMEFIREAHRRGIGVILDVVYNHFGPDTSLDLWQFDGFQENNKGGIYFYNDWRAETPWGSTRPDFGRPEVRQYIFDNVQMWLESCRIDGLRVDSTIFLRNVKGYNNDPSNDLAEGWQLLQSITNLASAINPAAITIGEDVGANEYITKPVKEGGTGFSAQWDVEFPHFIKEVLATDNPQNISLAGLLGTIGKRYSENVFQRIIFVDSHDSAANGAARFNETISPGHADSLFARKQALLAATILLTFPGVPMLFQGQEIMVGGSFNDWEAINWNLAKRHAGIVAAFTHLIELRKNTHGVSAGLSGQHLNVMHVDQENKVLAYHRWSNGGLKDDVMIIINFGNRQIENYVFNFPLNGTWKVRFNSTWKGYSPDFEEVVVGDLLVENGACSVTLPASSALILSQE